MINTSLSNVTDVPVKEYMYTVCSHTRVKSKIFLSYIDRDRGISGTVFACSPPSGGIQGNVAHCKIVCSS